MKQTIVIYFEDPGKLDKPFNDPLYFESYKLFSNYCADRETAVLFTRGDSYLGNMTFSHGWQFINNALTDINEQITANIILLKRRNDPVLTEGDLIVNDLDFRSLAGDKWQTYQFLHDFMPATYQINTHNWQAVIGQITTDKVVLKPTTESGGKGIIIADKGDLDFSRLNIQTAYIAQDFVDSSKGIPGICTGYHDLRIIMFNGEPKLSYIRTPKEGSLLSNISQGASAKVVAISDIPSEILETAKAIDAQLSQYKNRIYTTDFFVGPDQPYLVELNTMPGFPRADAEGYEFMQQYYGYMFDALSEAVANHKSDKER